jgi:hypothetical protein
MEFEVISFHAVVQSRDTANSPDLGGDVTQRRGFPTAVLL